MSDPSAADVDGAAIIGGLLRLDAAIVALVPVERIKGGALPEGVELPALLIRTASSNERPMLRRRGTVRQLDRVAVLVRATSWREQRAIIGAVRRACAGLVGDLLGAQRVAIAAAGTGPDMRGPANSFDQNQDFRVSFDARA